MNNSLRFRVLMRDQFTCVYCGGKPPDVVLHVDHLTPRSQGGADAHDNLVTACANCNMGKLDAILPDELLEAFRIRAPLPPLESKRRIKERPIKQSVVRIPAPVREPKPKRQYVRVERKLPHSLNVPYRGPDDPHPRWICSECGFTNELEGDQCSCRRAKEPERDPRGYCEDCDAYVLEEELDEFRGRCESCFDEWYWATCQGCEEAPRVGEDRELCESCALADSVRPMRGWITVLP